MNGCYKRGIAWWCLQLRAKAMKSASLQFSRIISWLGHQLQVKESYYDDDEKGSDDDWSIFIFEQLFWFSFFQIKGCWRRRIEERLVWQQCQKDFWSFNHCHCVKWLHSDLFNLIFLIAHQFVRWAKKPNTICSMLWYPHTSPSIITVIFIMIVIVIKTTFVIEFSRVEMRSILVSFLPSANTLITILTLVWFP